MKYFKNNLIAFYQTGGKTDNSVSSGRWRQIDEETITPEYSLPEVEIEGKHPIWDLPGYKGKENKYKNFTQRDKDLIWRNTLARNLAGLQYMKWAAPLAASPALFIAGGLGAGNALVNAGKNMIMHPVRTAAEFAGAELGGRSIDRGVQKITGDNNFGEMVGRVTGTPELNGFYQFFNPGYLAGGFAGDVTHKIVKEGAERVTPRIMDRVFIGRQPVAVTPTGQTMPIPGTEDSWVQMMSRKRNKGGHKGNTPKTKTKETTQPVEEVKPSEPEPVAKPEPEPISTPEPIEATSPETATTEAEPIISSEKKNLFQRIKSITRKKGKKKETPTAEEQLQYDLDEGVKAMEEESPTAEEQLQYDLDEGVKAMEEESTTVTDGKSASTSDKEGDFDILDYYDQLRGNKPSSKYRKKNAKKFLKASLNLKDWNYKETTTGLIKKYNDEQVIKRYLGEENVRTKESYEKALKEAEKEALDFNSKRMAHNKKTLRWAIPTGVAAIGVPSLFFFGNKASTNNQANDENQRIDVARGDNMQTTTTTQTPVQPTINAFNAADSSNIEAMREEMKNFGY